MIQEEDERKDRIDNMINAIKALNSHYAGCMRRIAEFRLETLNQSNNKEELASRHQAERKRFEEKAKIHKDALRKMYKQMIASHQKGVRNTVITQEFQALEEKDKCFEELGQGIRFSASGTDVFVNLYTIRNGKRKVNHSHKKLQKRLQSLFLHLRNERKGKSLGSILIDTKNKYFQGLKLLQYGMRGCESCHQVLRYCEKQNSFLSPLMVFKQTQMRFYHDTCLEQKI